VLGFIRHANVQRGAIDIGKDGYATDIHLAQCANDANRDLAPVGDENLTEHAR
jgi:hypothetical protein